MGYILILLEIIITILLNVLFSFFFTQTTLLLAQINCSTVGHLQYMSPSLGMFCTCRIILHLITILIYKPVHCGVESEVYAVHIHYKTKQTTEETYCVSLCERSKNHMISGKWKPVPGDLKKGEGILGIKKKARPRPHLLLRCFCGRW